VPELAELPSAPSRLPHHFLPPGGLIVTSKPCEVTTLLGPCVAVTFWCRRSQVAAICHAMLPAASAGERPVAGTPRWKYVREAIPETLARFTRKGGNPAAAEVKLFGGADLLGNREADPIARIGSQNVRLAREILAEWQLELVAFDVAGHTGRKLIFHTPTGDVRVKHLPKSSVHLA
jgi:chemotaxis protein CheD